MDNTTRALLDLMHDHGGDWEIMHAAGCVTARARTCRTNSRLIARPDFDTLRRALDAIAAGQDVPNAPDGRLDGSDPDGETLAALSRMFRRYVVTIEPRHSDISRFVAVARDLATRPHTVVTADLSELRTVLG